MQESFQPIPITSPSQNYVIFCIRCILDLQFKSIIKYLRPAISKLKGRIIDIGAGESPWRDWLSPGCTYYGLDIEVADKFNMTINRPDITYYSGGKMPFKSESFDAAICIEVLEHSDDPELMLSEIFRIIKPGSQLLLSVPWSARYHHIPHDYYRFTRSCLIKLFNKAGFTSINIIERGNDADVITNKLIVLYLRLLKPSKYRNLIWSFPLSLMVAPLAFIMLIMSNLFYKCFDQGGKNDPLGFFITAFRPEESINNYE